MTNVIEEKLNKLSLGYITKKSCLFEKYMTIQIYGSDVIMLMCDRIKLIRNNKKSNATIIFHFDFFIKFNISMNGMAFENQNLHFPY